MNKIGSFEEYRAIAAEGKQLPNMCSNCYFLPAAVKEKIGNEMLYIERVPGGILILEREQTFFRFYYYLSLDADFEPVDLPMPTVAEFVFQQALSREQCAQVQCLHKMGFCLGRESARMRLDAGTVLNETSNEVKIAEESDLDAVFAMIEANFDPLYAYIGTKEELLETIRKGHVFVIRQNETPVAALHANFAKGNASIRHLVVSKSCRGRSYGSKLVSFYHNAFQDTARNFSHWVDKHNEAAIALYTKLGYSFDGRYANEYIKK